MDGLVTDITPPSDVNFNAFAASSAKLFTLNVNDSSPVVPVGTSYEFKVSDWNNNVTWYNSTYTSISATPSFTHDFRMAKSSDYHLSIKDPFGNITTGTVKVVADIPADVITSPITGFTAG